jgi:hypothetical protein
MPGLTLPTLTAGEEAAGDVTPESKFVDCDEGYYCSGGSWTPRPRGDIDAAEGATGGICTAGHYCPVGSTDPTPCPAGTYLVSEGMIQESDCINCPAGSYCGGAGSASPTGDCQAGFYCGESSIQADQDETAAGFYTPAGSASQIACAPGSYSDAPQAEACTPCDSGTYCAAVQATGGESCPEGSYCPEGAVHPRQCLAGTY